MDFLNHAAVILKDQLKIIEISVWNWRDPNLEAQMREEGGPSGVIPRDDPIPGLLYVNINGRDENDFFMKLDDWQVNYYKEVDSNLEMRENKAHLKAYLKEQQKGFIKIKNDFSQEEKRVGRRIIPYFKFANAEIKNDTDTIKPADEEVKNINNPTYEEIEVKENPTYEEFEIMLACSNIFYELKKINIDIINKLELRLNKIEKKGGKIKTEPKLSWHGGITDLAELITSLVESDKIRSFPQKQKITRKYAQQQFEEFFGYEMKNFDSLLSYATKRKNDYAPFLSLLKETFEKYVEKLKKKHKQND